MIGLYVGIDETVRCGCQQVAMLVRGSSWVHE